MPTPEPHMLREIREAPAVIERLLRANDKPARKIATAIRARNRRFGMTVARGSSDHAATHLKYAFETHLGLPIASAAPSVTTHYGRHLRVDGALVIAISQSGASPDVVETVTAARESGALTVALVNRVDSPLANAAEFVLPLHAGEEQAVAATKSFLASLAAGVQLLAHLRLDLNLTRALERLPETLTDALALETLARLRAERYRYATSMTVLGRGLHHGVAQEAALKLKETSGIHAEAFSSAEFAHGPVRILQPGHPVLAYHARDATTSTTLGAFDDLIRRGAEVTLIGADAPLTAPVRLLTPPTGHALTDPITSALATYLLTAHLALTRGQNPDAPPTLSKVTLTR